MKFYKNLLKFIQIAVVLVVLPRVAEFVGQLSPPSTGFSLHGIIRVAFALTLGLGTIATAYFANDAQPPEYDDEPTNPRERKRREREAVYFATMLNAAPAARKAVVLFATLDGSFNLAEAVRGATANGMLEPTLDQWHLAVNIGATVLFGVSPTILSLVLAYVISLVDRIPMDYERPPSSKKEIDWVRTIMGNMGVREFRAGEAAALLTDGERSDEQIPNTEHRTNGNHRPANSEQRQRILAYINSHATPERVPGVREIREVLPEPKPSLSTISEARRLWLEKHDPWERQSA